MIQHMTRLKVADNSGVQEVGCIRVMGRGQNVYGSLGDQIVCSAKQVTPQSPIAKGSVLKGVIVRCKQPVKRADGTEIKFDDNAVVIVDDNGNPRCTRVFGPVARELRDRKFMRIVSLAEEVV
ncbi:MAG: 50S ribosomal protein L14 [Armatimonadetes bacterium]|jgi:large subunit ribosomal protein L14|nr:50S ribosomal protein L14 [Armatimonadota bacterium]MDI9582721.1 50S ribosomal protein L14 [Acidobacteriota bacterium]